MSFEVVVTGDKEVAGYLRSVPNRIRGRLRDELTRIAIDLQSRVVDEKLNGGVLNRKTGKLSRSIQEVVIEDRKAIAGFVWSNMGAPSYASFWEFGFSGNQTVRNHLRLQTKCFGRPMDPPREVTVNTFTRQVDSPARSFLRSSLAEMKDSILNRMDSSVGSAL